MQRTAGTIAEYLAKLSPEERADIQTVRRVIRKNLPRGYKESVQWGMICYSIPLSRFSDTYNGHALCYAALAAQKNYNSLYLMNVYGHRETEKWFRERYKASGKRLDMGKSCVRFHHADELPLDLIGEAIARTSVQDYIHTYQMARPARKAAAKKAKQAKTAKKAPARKHVVRKKAAKKR